MSPTVLVADDSRTIRKMVQWALKGSAYEIWDVGSAQETMEAAKNQPSVILLDYHMPDGSGYEVCRALKNGGPTSGIPVVMLGGAYHDFDEEQARSAGADEIVMKPFKTDDLLDAIDSASQASVSAHTASQLGDQVASSGPDAPAPEPGGPGAGSASPTAGSGTPGAGAQDGAGQAPGGGQAGGGPPEQPAGGDWQGGGGDERGSQPRMRMDDSSGPSQPPPQRDSGSQPRMRTPSGSGAGSKPGSQPRIPDSGSQPRSPGSGSQSQPSRPDVNASTRQQQVSSGSGASAPSTGGGDSGVSSVGASRAEIEKMVQEEVRRSVKEQLPGLLRNIMGEVFQKKVLPKLLDHGQERVQALVEDELEERIRVYVRDEIERLLAEE